MLITGSFKGNKGTLIGALGIPFGLISGGLSVGICIRNWRSGVLITGL